jgi:Bacterial Ig-like domain (group 3)
VGVDGRVMRSGWAASVTRARGRTIARALTRGVAVWAVLGASALAWVGLGAGAARAETLFSPADGLVSPLTVTKISGLSAEASASAAGATQVVYTASFEVETGLAAHTGYVQLTAPTGAVFSTDGDSYEVTDGAKSAQSGEVQVDPEHKGEDNVVDVHIPSSFSVSAHDTVKVAAYGAANPTAEDLSAEFSVFTSADTEPVSTEFPIGPKTSVGSLSVGASTTSAGASKVVYTATFKAAEALSNGGGFGANEKPGYIRIAGPKGTVFGSDGYSYLVSDNAEKVQAAVHITVDPEHKGEDNVVDVDVPSLFKAGVAAGETVTVEAYGATNPSSAEPAGGVSVSTSSDVEPVSKPLAIGAATAVSEVRASASTTSAGASSVIYEASFKATTALTDGAELGVNEQPGVIRLTAPAGTVFGSDGYSYLVSDKAEDHQAIHVKVDPEGLGENVVDVNVPPSFKANISAGETVTVEAYGAKNPTAEVPAGQLSVSTTSDIEPVSTGFAIGPETEVGDASIGSLGGAYTVRFATRSNVSDGDYEQFGDDEQPGYVQVSLPGATMPSSAGDYTFTVTSVQHGTQESGVLHVEASGETVRVKPRQTIEAGSLVALQIAGITGSPTASALISTSSDAKPVSVGSTALAPLSGTVTYDKTPVSEANVQACRTPSGACLTTSTNPSGQFTFGVPATKGASYALTANPPAFVAAAQGRIPRVTIPGAAGVSGIDLALAAPGKIAKGVTVVSAGHGEQTSATSDPVKFWGEPYELKLPRSLFPKHGIVLVTQVVRHGTNALTGEPMTQVTDIGGSVDGLVTGLVLGKRQGPLTVDMPAAYPMHGEVSTSVNYRMLRRKARTGADLARRAGAVRGAAKEVRGAANAVRRAGSVRAREVHRRVRRAGVTHAPVAGRHSRVRRAALSAQAQNASNTGIAGTQVLDEVYPSEGEIPTDPLPAYFLNYGDSDGVSIGPGSIAGPDKQNFQIVPLSSSGVPKSSTDCGSSAAVLERYTGSPSTPPPSTECGIAVRFTPPEAPRAHKIYYRATLYVTDGSGADATTIPVTLFGCDARVAEEAGEVSGAGACYQGVNGHEENAAGPEQQQHEIEEEEEALEEELLRLEEEEAEQQEIEELKEELEEFKQELEQLKEEIELEEIERVEEIGEELGELYGELEYFEELPQTPEVEEIEEAIEEEIAELEEDLEEGEIGEGGEGGEGGGGSAAAGEEYEDPSGAIYAQTPEGPVPLPGATVTLKQSYDEAGPFVKVPPGSTIMSPANRTNPDETSADGLFGWDVLAGYYTIEASKTGCASQTTSVLSIPPPVSDLELTLACPGLPPRSETSASVSSSSPTSEYGQPVTFTAKVGGGTSPTGTVTFDACSAWIGQAVLSQNGEATLTLSTLATGAYSITASYSGDGANRPATSGAITQAVGSSASSEYPCGEKPAGEGSTGGSGGSGRSGGSGGGGSSSGPGSGPTGHPSGRVRLLGTKLEVSRAHHVTVKLSCTGQGGCTGKLTLEIAVKSKHGKHRRVKHETIAAGAFSIVAGKTVAVKLVLDRAGATLLRKHHGRLAAKLTIRGSSTPAQTSTDAVLLAVKKPQAKRRKR